MTSIRQRNVQWAARSRRNGQRTRIARTGAAVVEFAFIAPLLIMLTFGMIELGRLVMVKQLMINASREGARFAVLPSTTTSEEVETHVRTELENSKVYGAVVNVLPDPFAPETGDPVTVSVSINSSAVSWIPKPMFVFDKTLQASTTMRRESW